MVLTMSKKKVFLLVTSLFVMVSLTASPVLAQQWEFYDRFQPFIDVTIYFIFFLSIAQVTLGKHFKDSGGKGVVIAVGLALTAGMFIWA